MQYPVKSLFIIGHLAPDEIKYFDALTFNDTTLVEGRYTKWENKNTLSHSHEQEFRNEEN